ncbi:MAG: hypothetical protein IJ773_08435 [Lachnospiraceae bacterium]|nr:hypothetical protein [Lachnospiraceae bacterium]
MRSKFLQIVFICFCLSVSVFSISCSGKPKEVAIDYTDVTAFETALRAGEDLTGKVVMFTVMDFKPDSAFGYNLMTGEHLNFCSSRNPGAKIGDTLTVKVTDVRSLLGSFIISYEIVN